MSPYTVQGKVRALRAFSSWLFREGYTPENILCYLKLPKVPAMLIETLTAEEIDQLIDRLGVTMSPEGSQTAPLPMDRPCAIPSRYPKDNFRSYRKKSC